MYIIVVGGGKVGYSLCRALLDEGQEVLVIEKDAIRCERINEDMGAVCMHGDGCETATLAEAGASRADMLVAATDEDEDNLVSCQVAKHKYNVANTIAIVNNPKNEKIFKKLGIDSTVSAANVLMEHIGELVPAQLLVHLLSLEPEGRQVVEIKIPPDSEALGRRINELSLPPETLLCALIRKGSLPAVPSGDTIVKSGDRFLAIAIAGTEKELRAELAGN